jgi:putative hemolysin
VVFLDASTPVARAATTVSAARHSRFPVVDGSPDEVLGFVHLRDLLIRPAPETATTVRELTRPLRSLPASKGVLAALAEMRRAGDHLALVVDEYGGTAGIVTLEDLLEELVGEIADEYDTEEPELEQVGEHEYRVDGKMSIDEVNEILDVELPDEEWDTVGGLMLGLMGSIPEEGDEVAFQNLAFRAERVDGRRISKIRITRKSEDEPAEAAAEEANRP